MGNMFKGSLSDHFKMQLKAFTKPQAPHKKFKETTRNAKGMMSGSTWLKGVERKQGAEYQSELSRLESMYGSESTLGGTDGSTTTTRKRTKPVSLLTPRSGVTLEEI